MSTIVQHKQGTDDLIVFDKNWLDLGALRALVAEADDRGWGDESLISATISEHPYRHDIRIVRRLVVEGGR